MATSPDGERIMSEVTERVDALEEALMKLAYAQFNTEMELQKLSKK